MPLTEDQVVLIKASVPFLQEKGNELAKHMYDLMLSQYPEVRPLFNPAHQKSLHQPKILSFALLQYARYIDNLGVLSDFVQQIVTKHVGLQILPEHYPIVATCIIQSLKDILGDKATDDLIAAWIVAYNDLANILMQAEESKYASNEHANGGWRHYRDFTVVRIIKECEGVLSIELKASDNKPVITAVNGQYLGFSFVIDGKETRREYSISGANTSSYDYRISVRRVPNGLVSGYIHTQLKVGDVLKIAPPSGNFSLAKSDAKDIVLLAGGIGITPLLSVAEAALEAGKRVHLIQCVRSPAQHPFKDWAMAVELRANPNFKLTTFYSRNPSSVVESDDIYARRIQKSDLESYLNSEIYALGPKNFMITLMADLKDLNYPTETVKTESFGVYQIY